MNRRSFIKRTVAALVAVSFLPLRSVFSIAKKPRHCLGCTFNYSDKCKGCPSRCSICQQCGGPLVPHDKLYLYTSKNSSRFIFPIFDAMYCKSCNCAYPFMSCRHRRQAFPEYVKVKPIDDWQGKE